MFVKQVIGKLSDWLAPPIGDGDVVEQLQHGGDGRGDVGQRRGAQDGICLLYTSRCV